MLARRECSFDELDALHSIEFIELMATQIVSSLKVQASRNVPWNATCNVTARQLYVEYRVLAVATWLLSTYILARMPSRAEEIALLHAENSLVSTDISMTLERFSCSVSSISMMKRGSYLIRARMSAVQTCATVLQAPS